MYCWGEKKGKESILVLACIYILKCLELYEKLVLLVTCFRGIGTWQIEGRGGKGDIAVYLSVFLDA